MARNGFSCADVPLRNYSLTHTFTHSLTEATMQLVKNDLFLCRVEIEEIWNTAEGSTLF